MSTLMRQYELLDPVSNAHLVVWLDRKLKRGWMLTLEESGDRVWQVLECYTTPADKQTLYKPWRVGGLV